MPPKTRQATRRNDRRPNESDEASAQIGRQTGRGRPRGSGRGRDRRQFRDREGAQIPEHQEEQVPTMAEMMAAGFQELRAEINQQINRQIRETVTAIIGDRQLGQEEVVPEEPVEEPQPGEPRPAHVRNRRAATVADFLKLKPPTFCGTDPQEDPQHFVRDISTIGEVLQCTSAELAELAAFQLKGAARVWKDSRPRFGSWEELREAFLDRFLPEGVRDAKRQAFEDLWMTNDMEVTEFELQFMELAQYAENIVPT